MTSGIKKGIGIMAKYKIDYDVLVRCSMTLEADDADAVEDSVRGLVEDGLFMHAAHDAQVEEVHEVKELEPS